MEITDTARPFDGANVSAFLRSLPAEPLLLGLGEPRHFVGELGALRNELFRHLVEHEGYRAFAIESDCLAALLVDDHVTTGAGALDDVMARGFSHGFGASPANRELVHWMRAYNQTHDDKLRFFGFDGPLEYWADSPRQALTALYDLLDGPHPCTRETLDALLGPDDRWANQAAATDPAQSIGQTPDARRLRVIADDLAALLETQAPGLAPHDRERAELYARTAVGLLRYHHWMADDSPGRWSRLSALRDAMMAANLRAIADHGPALVFGHNVHLQRDRSLMSFGDRTIEWWGAGAITATRLRDRYAVLATALGTVGDDTPPPDTLEGILATLPWDPSLADARRLAAAVAKPTPRTAAEPFGVEGDVAEVGGVDGIVFLGRVHDLG
jgi:erythromycin esterase-like protein